MTSLRFAFRQVLRNAAVSAIAAVTLGLGLGASALIFGVIDGVLLRPLPYPDADRIVRVRQTDGLGSRANPSDPNFFDLKEQTGAFSAFAQFSGSIESVTGGSEPVRLDVTNVSREFFAVIGIQPLLGRAFTADEQQLGAAPAVLVSHGYWQRYLGGTADFASRVIEIGGRSHSIVGVMPAGFDFPDGTDIWEPRELWPASPSRTGHNYAAIGRLAPGITLEQSRADLGAIARRLKELHGDDTWMADVHVVPLLDELVGRVRPALLLLAAGAVLLLLVAWANVASLLLARTIAREQELAVRAALGAPWRRLAGQVFAEAIVLCGAGCVLGVALAAWGLELIAVHAVDLLPRAATIGVEWTTIVVVVALALAVAATLSIAAASRITGHASLRANRRTIAGGARAGVRETLVGAQIALALVLLVVGTLLARSFLRVADVDPGIDTEGVVFMELARPFSSGDAELAARNSRFYADVIAGLRELPGVDAVGAVNVVPLGNGGANGRFLKQNHVGEIPNFGVFREIARDPARTGFAEFRIADEGYFAAVGIPLLRGRVFDERDGPDAVHAAVISRSLADSEWPDEDALGKLVNFAGMDGDLTPFTIVGIVGDVRDYGLESPSRETFYVSYRQRPLHLSSFSIVLRSPDPLALVPAAREVVRRIDADVPPQFVPVQDLLARTLDARRFNVMLLGIFGGTALLLALTGIYGAIAFSVAQRFRELGLRIALGARADNVIATVLRTTVLTAIVGIGVGIAFALGVAELMAALLYGVSPRDPTAYAAAAALVLASAVVAAWLPVGRATAIDPMAVLRQE